MSVSATRAASASDVEAVTEGRRLRSGTALVALGAIANQGSTLLVNIAAARALPSASFGAYAATLTTVQTAATVLALGLGYTASRYVPELRVQDPHAAGRVIGGTLVACVVLGSAGALGVGMSAEWIATSLLSKGDVAAPLRLAARSYWVRFSHRTCPLYASDSVHLG